MACADPRNRGHLDGPKMTRLKWEGLVCVSHFNGMSVYFSQRYSVYLLIEFVVSDSACVEFDLTVVLHKDVMICWHEVDPIVAGHIGVFSPIFSHFPIAATNLMTDEILRRPEWCNSCGLIPFYRDLATTCPITSILSWLFTADAVRSPLITLIVKPINS